MTAATVERGERMSKRQGGGDRYPRIVEKAADDQRCNICLEPGPLTDDHVPPESCLVDKKVELLGLDTLIGGAKLAAMKSQSGIRFQTICRRCNNERLGKYDNALSEFCSRIRSFYESRLVVPPRFARIELACRPRAIMHVLIGHLLAAKSFTDSDYVDEPALRECVMDPTLPVPRHLHVFYWAYPYRSVTIARDLAMPERRGRWDSFAMFSLMKFYPVALMLTTASAYEGLTSLDEYRGATLDEVSTIPLWLDFLQRPEWPDAPDDGGNMIMGGRSFSDAVVATPARRR